MKAGQIVVQQAGKHSSGVNLLMIVGIVPDLGIFKEHHQYTATVTESGITIPYDPSGIDLHDQLIGMGIGNALTLPIWRIG